MPLVPVLGFLNVSRSISQPLRQSVDVKHVKLTMRGPSEQACTLPLIRNNQNPN